ncbi:hypothetical protein [Citrobacter braakii]|nr:hypothetical protein [Citrobacter braakii]
MKKLKLVVIGAGSSYTPELIEGVIKNYHLNRHGFNRHLRVI